MKKQAFAVILAIAAIAIIAYAAQAPAGLPRLNVTAYPQPAGIGYATIKVEADRPLDRISVAVPDRGAVFDRQDGNTYYFRYFVSPYDKIGLKPIRVAADGAIDESASLYVGYNAAGKKFNDVLFYSYEFDPALKSLEMLLTGRINLFFEGKPYPDDGNSEVINAAVPLIISLKARGITGFAYFVGADNGEWLSCTQLDLENETENGTVLPVGDCAAVFNSTNSLVIRYPDYPTTQVFVSNSTIEIQPAPGEVRRAVNGTIEMMDYVPPMPIIETNGTTSDNSTQP